MAVGFGVLVYCRVREPNSWRTARTDDPAARARSARGARSDAPSPTPATATAEGTRGRVMDASADPNSDTSPRALTSLLSIHPSDARLFDRVAKQTGKPPSAALRRLVQRAHEGASLQELQDHIDRDLDRNLVVQFEARRWLGQLRAEAANPEPTAPKSDAGAAGRTNTTNTTGTNDSLGGFGHGGGNRRVHTPRPSAH